MAQSNSIVTIDHTAGDTSRRSLIRPSTKFTIKRPRPQVAFFAGERRQDFPPSLAQRLRIFLGNAGISLADSLFVSSSSISWFATAILLWTFKVAKRRQNVSTSASSDPTTDGQNLDDTSILLDDLRSNFALVALLAGLDSGFPVVTPIPSEEDSSPLHPVHSQGLVSTASTDTLAISIASENDGKPGWLDRQLGPFLTYPGKHEVKRKSNYNYHFEEGNCIFTHWRSRDIPKHILKGTRERKTWKVGIAYNPFIFLGRLPKADPPSKLSKELAHWAVYTCEVGSGRSDAQYRVYGINFDVQERYLFLEQAWATPDGWVVRPKDLQRLPHHETTMYFAKEEFALHAEHYFRCFIRESPSFKHIALSEDIPNSAKAYDLLRRNCKHFCIHFLQYLIEQRFLDESRLLRLFSFTDLALEFSSELQGKFDRRTEEVLHEEAPGSTHLETESERRKKDMQPRVDDIAEE